MAARIGWDNRRPTWGDVWQRSINSGGVFITNDGGVTWTAVIFPLRPAQTGSANEPDGATTSVYRLPIFTEVQHGIVTFLDGQALYIDRTIDGWLLVRDLGRP